MANISTYLAAIMAAVYGEDVRGSIHDAIDIINKVGEVVLNTGTAITGPTSSSTGFYEGSFYINTNTMELWKCIGTNSWQSQGVLKGADGTDGSGITSIVKTATVGLVDTYTITFDDGNTTTYNITNGQNGSKWYKGTAISGTGTSITGFPGVKDDYYLNSTYGYVYVCTRSGGASVPDPAEWDYVLTLSGGGGTSVTVIDGLTSTSSTDALSANQGRVLNENKIANPSTKSANDVLTYDGTDWIAQAPAAVPSDADDITYDNTSSHLLATNVQDAIDEVKGNISNATVTLKRNASSQIGSFTVNQSSNSSIELPIDEWSSTATVDSNNQVTFNGLSDSYGYDLYCQNKVIGISAMTKTGSGSSVTLTYTVTGAASGDVCKLRILK